MADSVNSTTADRILNASLQLFNERGLQDVPAMKIAMHLGISPGHLAYHFKTKNDIVVAVFGRLETEVRKELLEAKRPEQPFLPITAARQQIALLRTLWRYRFFFNALTQLLTKDLTLRERYLRMEEGIIEGIYQLFDELISQNYMFKVPEPNSTRMLARSCWMMWLSWLRFEQIEYPDRKSVRETALHDGVMQNFSIIQPYFGSEFEREMLNELRQATLGKASRSSAKTAKPKSAAVSQRVTRKKS
ncbi:TetR/AcrR family transcriptional regulator [Hydrocarboniphaga sp.]|uniref:TetR/AcrR family transcriptional regulator n=1 Tax=Hydrocarboniphaga sp. TaxID=2033016 RepID=UPI003D13EF88